MNTNTNQNLNNVDEKDFTYFFKKTKSVISAIRLTQYIKNNKKTNDVIITIYYPFRSFSLELDESLNIDKKNMIYENDDNHMKDFHKKDDPYDWHLHIKVNKNKTFDVLKDVFKKSNILMKNLEIMRSIYYSENINKNKNYSDIDYEVEYKGNNSADDFINNRIKTLGLDVNYNILKYDKNMLNSYYAYASYCSLYINKKPDISVSTLELFSNINIKNKTLTNFKFIFNHKNKKNKDIIEKNLKSALNLFFNIIKKKNIDCEVIINQSKVNNSANMNHIDIQIINNKYIIRISNVKNMIKGLIDNLLSVEYNVPLNNSILQYISIFYMAFIKYHINYNSKKMNMSNYINTRLGIELGWNLFQAVKFNQLNKPELYEHFSNKVNLLLLKENQKIISQKESKFTKSNIKKTHKSEDLIKLLEPKILLIKNKMMIDDIITTKDESCLM